MRLITVILTIDYKAKAYLTVHGDEVPALHSSHFGEKLEVRVSLLDLLDFEGNQGETKAKQALTHCGRKALIESNKLARRHSNLGNLSVTIRSFCVKNTGSFLFELG